MTIARSSTISQPTAMRPLVVPSALRSSSAFTSTTVLATDSARPRIRPAPNVHPQSIAIPAPISVASTICTTAPGIAMLRTASSAPREKCSPTPNMSRITPISASWPAIAVSALKPGIDVAISTPATR